MHKEILALKQVIGYHCLVWLPTRPQQKDCSEEGAIDAILPTERLSVLLVGFGLHSALIKFNPEALNPLRPHIVEIKSKS